MSSHLNLFVYVIGPGSSSFPVTMERSETVGHLKKAILKEKPNDLKDVDADRLILYKVELPDDENLEQSAHDATKEELRVPSRVLSKIFPSNLPEETVSILVGLPKELGNPTLVKGLGVCLICLFALPQDI
jgi:hypothetical protein